MTSSKSTPVSVTATERSTARTETPASQALTLAQAWDVINAQREAQAAKQAEVARKLIGRFFKYRNRSAPGIGWWLYAMPTELTDYGAPTGLTFERRSYDGAIDVRLKGDLITLRYGLEDSGWEEITATEFWNAAREIRDEVIADLTPSVLSQTEEGK